MADEEGRSARNAKKYAHVSNIIIKQEIRARMKQVNGILKKPTEERTPEELRILEQSPDIASVVQKRSKHRQLAKDRTQEVEDPPDVLSAKCQILAEALKNAKCGIIYSGAGISTAASIPDYRGPNGVWTMLQKGMLIKPQDLSDAEPTITHMSITKLQQEGKVKHVVSQNCDGLHLRSGFPRCHLSEVHGNMYIELCKNCKPAREYIRLFDVTERTAVRRHHTSRMCHMCGVELRDTIIHFGEKAPFTSPYNWEEAAEWADEADFILCLGSSLKVVKKYGCLWNLHKPFAKRPKLFIVNLQWTPKDDSATLKINGKCDEVMSQLMTILGYKVPVYKRGNDPIFKLAVELYPLELKTTSKKILSMSPCLQSPEPEDDHSMRHCADSPPVACADAAATCTDSADTCMDLTVTYIDSVANCGEDSVCVDFPIVCIDSSAPVNSSCSDGEMTVVLSCTEAEDVVLQQQEDAVLAMSASDNSSSGSPSDDGSMRTLIRSRLQLRMCSSSEHPTVDNLVVMEEGEEEEVEDREEDDGEEGEGEESATLPQRPSNKYKLIKYLLNKPPDVAADDKLPQLTPRMRELCDTVVLLGDWPVSPGHTVLPYSNADSLRQLTPLSVPQQAGDAEPRGGVSVKASYPTLVCALMQQRPVVKEPAPVVRLHDSKYQPLMGSLCGGGGTSNADAISKLRSLMEGRPKMEPLLIETGVSTAHHVGKPGTQPLAPQTGAAPSGADTQLLLATALPSSDQAAMLIAYRPAEGQGQPGKPAADPSVGSERGFKRRSDPLDEAPCLGGSPDAEQTENISPSQTASMPGWFGKGLNIKKRRKKVR